MLLSILIASPQVADVAEQQRAVYRTDKIRRHYFDAVVTWKSGRRVAYAIKYRAQVKPALQATLDAVCYQHGDRFADEYRIATEAHVHLLDYANARRIISCAGDFDYEAREAVLRFLRRRGPHVSLHACDAWVGDGRRGSRAAIALVQAGALVVPHGTVLGNDAVLVNRFTK